jgi:hypothetical protein
VLVNQPYAVLRAKSLGGGLPAMSRLATFRVDTRDIQTDEDITSNYADVLALCEYIQAGSFSGSRCTHQRGQRSRFHVAVNVVQKSQASSSLCCGRLRQCNLAVFRRRTWHRIAHPFPAKSFSTVLDMAKVGKAFLIPSRFSFFIQSTRFWCLGGIYDGASSTCRVLHGTLSLSS